MTCSEKVVSITGSQDQMSLSEDTMDRKRYLKWHCHGHPCKSKLYCNEIVFFLIDREREREREPIL